MDHPGLGPSVCYYCLVRNDASEPVKREGGPEDGENDFYFSEEYVVCFVTTFPNDDDDGFDL